MTPASGVRFLDPDMLIFMHAELLARWGGDEGGGHRGEAGEGAEAAAQAVKNSYYDTIEELAAAYAVYIVFLDGNKRTAAAALATFMVGNGVELRLSDIELFRAMLDLQQRSEQGERVDRLIVSLVALLEAP